MTSWAQNDLTFRQPAVYGLAGQGLQAPGARLLNALSDGGSADNLLQGDGGTGLPGADGVSLAALGRRPRPARG
jgi:hypothetical protein